MFPRAVSYTHLYTIAEFNNQDTITEWGLTPDNEIHSLYDMSAKWVCADKGATTYMRAEDGKVPSDWSGYGYLNPVSYTHLDVYKRQNRNKEKLFIMIGIWAEIRWCFVHNN